jgi:hypothetical protein
MNNVLLLLAYTLYAESNDNLRYGDVKHFIMWKRREGKGRELGFKK